MRVTVASVVTARFDFMRAGFRYTTSVEVRRPFEVARSQYPAPSILLRLKSSFRGTPSTRQAASMKASARGFFHRAGSTLKGPLPPWNSVSPRESCSDFLKYGRSDAYVQPVAPAFSQSS